MSVRLSPSSRPDGGPRRRRVVVCACAASNRQAASRAATICWSLPRTRPGAGWPAGRAAAYEYDLQGVACWRPAMGPWRGRACVFQRGSTDPSVIVRSGRVAIRSRRCTTFGARMYGTNGSATPGVGFHSVFFLTRAHLIEKMSMVSAGHLLFCFWSCGRARWKE